MRNLSGPERQRRLEIVGQLCVLRLRAENYSVDEVAEKLGFGSVEAMHMELQKWSLPEWLLGDAFAQQERSRKRRRQARSVGSLTPLPPAAGAVELLKYPLKVLSRELKDLAAREEYLQSERFVGKRLDGDKQVALGALQAPPEPLTTLIAVYALVLGHAEMFMWQLLDKLHPSEQIDVREKTSRGTFSHVQPDPQEVDVERLEQAVQELRKKAEDVATLVRGGKIRRGPSTEEILPRHQAVVKLVKQHQQEGFSDKQIAEELNKRFDRGPFGLEGDFTAEEVRWLKSLPSNAAS